MRGDPPLAGQATEGDAARALLVEARKLMRDCLQRALEGALPDWRIVAVPSALEARAEAFDLAVLCHGTAESTLSAQATKVLAQFPGLRLLAVIDPGNEPEARHLVELGVAGLVSSRSTARILAAAMNLVARGGRFVPPELLDPVRPGSHGGGNLAPDAILNMSGAVLNPDGRFTRREVEILTFLHEGLQNKIIAFRLGISESTVKVHLKNIMKKLNARNRTQALFFVQRMVGGSNLLANSAAL
ncbi:MAG: response regulator transcription factor [Hyphomicrobiales bacterium]|nr:response regulator transcription factor [Hyphomicrobiales bacterium]